MPQVTQADREAATTTWQHYVARPGECIVENGMRKGQMDESLMVQAFAAHREAERDRIVATLREWLDNYQDEADHWPVIDDLGDLLTAIEKGAHHG